MHDEQRMEGVRAQKTEEQDDEGGSSVAAMHADASSVQRVEAFSPA